MDLSHIPKEGQILAGSRTHQFPRIQAGSRANTLRSLLKSEAGRSPGFLRLANALPALYPKESEERRVLDAMVLTAPQ